MRWTMLLLCALLAGATTGCFRFQAGSVPAPEPGESRTIGQARVTTTESRYYLLRDVRVTADSVAGWDTARNAAGPQRIALHRSQVRRFERERVDVVRTGLVVAAAAYVAAVILGYRGAEW